MDRTGNPGYPAEDHCITFYYDEHGASAIGRRPNSTVEVVGVVGVNRSTDEVDLWACSNTFITVHDVVDARDRHPSSLSLNGRPRHAESVSPDR
jgi:hypothetical protein